MPQYPRSFHVADPEPGRQHADKDGERPDAEVDLGAEEHKRDTRRRDRDRGDLGDECSAGSDNGQEEIGRQAEEDDQA